MPITMAPPDRSTIGQIPGEVSTRNGKRRAPAPPEPRCSGCGHRLTPALPLCLGCGADTSVAPAPARREERDRKWRDARLALLRQCERSPEGVILCPPGSAQEPMSWPARAHEERTDERHLASVWGSPEDLLALGRRDRHAVARMAWHWHTHRPRADVPVTRREARRIWRREMRHMRMQGRSRSFKRQRWHQLMRLVNAAQLAR